MRQILTILFISLLFSNSALAKSLLDVLKEAYQNNTELNAERENLIISEQELKISKSDYLPSATITSSKSQEDTNKLTNQSGGDASINDVDGVIGYQEPTVAPAYRQPNAAVEFPSSIKWPFVLSEATVLNGRGQLKLSFA